MTVTVIITRPKPAMARATEVYQAAGFDVHAAPCFDVVTSESIQTEWLRMSADVWVILSVPALEHALKLDPELKPQPNTRVLAVGPAVVSAWSAHFTHPIETHPMTNSEGVIELLKQQPPKSLHLFTTQGGRDLIQSHCMQQQISYCQFNTYQRQSLALDIEVLEDLFTNTGEVVLTATSVGVLEHLVESLPEALLKTIQASPVLVGSARIAKAALKHGFKDVLVAENPSDEAMSSCLVNSFQ